MEPGSLEHDSAKGVGEKKEAGGKEDDMCEGIEGRPHLQDQR